VTSEEMKSADQVTADAAANELAPPSAGHIRKSSSTKRVAMGQTVSAM